MSAIADLMSKDPLSLTREDKTAIIAELRAQRARFVEGNRTIGKPEARKSDAQKRKESVLASVGNISLDDLGL